MVIQALFFLKFLSDLVPSSMEKYFEKTNSKTDLFYLRVEVIIFVFWKYVASSTYAKNYLKNFQLLQKLQ